MKLLNIPLLVSILCSCFLSKEFTNGYNQLTEEQKSKIIPYTEAHSFEKGNIYCLSAQELLVELKKYPKSLVYVFTNGCSYKTCHPMAVYEDYAKIHNLKLFLVMNSYRSLHSTTNQAIDNPLFAIDADFYSDQKPKYYIDYFLNDLEGHPLDLPRLRGINNGNLFFYSGDHLDTTCFELPENKIITPSF
jgi:hypothetical protein